MVCCIGAMLRRVRVRNFKAIADEAVDLALAPITCLLGQNASGKSSVLEAVGLLVQSLVQAQRRSGWTHDGDRVHVPDEEVLYHRRDRTRELEIGVWVDAPSGSNVWGFVAASRRVKRDCPWEEWKQTLQVGDAVKATVASHYTSVSRDGANSENQIVMEAPVAWKGLPESSVVDYLLRRGLFRVTASNVPANVRAALAELDGVGEALPSVLDQGIATLGGVRGADLFQRELGPVTVRTGRFGEGTPRLLGVAYSDPARRKAVADVERWAEKFGMRNLAGGWAGAQELVLGYVDPGTGTSLPISSAGGGSQRLLPLIVDLFVGAPPRIVMIDELEEASHPAWQVQLIEMLAEACDGGRQVVFTTQSPSLVLALAAAVASGKIAPARIAMYEMDRDARGVRATRRDVRESGWIAGGWIESYAKVEQSLIGSWLRGEGKSSEATWRRPPSAREGSGPGVGSERVPRRARERGPAKGRR